LLENNIRTRSSTKELDDDKPNNPAISLRRKPLLLQETKPFVQHQAAAGRTLSHIVTAFQTAILRRL